MADYCDTPCPLEPRDEGNRELELNHAWILQVLIIGWRVIVQIVVDSNIGGSTDSDFYTPKIILQSSIGKGLSVSEKNCLKLPYDPAVPLLGIHTVAAFHTVYHAFVKYLILLISRDPPSQFFALLTGHFSISPASDVGMPWAPCLMFILCYVHSDREGDGWMASPTRWIWVWASSGWWWRTGKPGVLQSMGSQRVRLDWVTELNWTDVHSFSRRSCQVL